MLQLDAGALQITGTYHTGVPFEDQGVAVPLAAAQRDGRTAEATTIAVAVEPGVASSAVADRLERRYQGTIAIDQPGEATRADTNSLLLRKSTLVIAILALLLGGLTVANTMAMAVLERRAEFALLAAVGWSRPLVARLVVVEGLVLGGLGVAVGLGLGALAGKAAADVLGAAAVVAPVTGAGVLALGAAIGLTLGALGSIYPAWRVTRVPAAEALA
jgi:putative ABC transport system permease protein